MGVLGLWKLLEDGGKPVPLDTLENKILAVDISIWLHQTIKGFQDGRGNSLPNAHLTGLFIRLCKLLHYRIRPVFVFDGGVPVLKRQTIEKRSHMKSKTQTEANRIEQLLLEGLARENVVQQILGNKVKDLLSPVKRRAGEDRDEMFMLPESGEIEAKEDDEEFEEEEDELKSFYASRIQDIDVNSAHFKSIPADIRHTILFDMKESRKQSSWGRLHELPTQSDNFSEFQMKRLLKRRQVQVSLEKAETEMGGRSLTYNELENLMSEEGIIETSKKGKQLASDENTRFLLVKGIKSAMEEAKHVEAVEPQTEEELDLQKAIAMSLEDDPMNITQMDVQSTKEIRLNTQQKEILKLGAKASAKEYMQEYGVLTTDEITDLFKSPLEQDNEDVEDDDDPVPLDSQETIIYEKTAESISSSNDSDFVDVPEDDISGSQLNAPNDEYPLPLADPRNELRLEDIKKLEVVIDPTKKPEDDLFADIFEPKPTPKATPKPTSILEQVKAQRDALLNLTDVESLIEISDEVTPTKQNDADVWEIFTPKKKEKENEEPSLDPMTPRKSLEARLAEEKTPVKDPEKLMKNSPLTPNSTPRSVKQTPEKRVENAILSLPGTSSENLEQIKEKLRQEADRLKKGQDLDNLAVMASNVALENEALLQEMNKKDRHGLSITDRMTAECQTLLRLFGVPFIVAPMEAEAQCAFLNQIDLIDGIITDDSDVWLFGGKTVYKNFFDKEKVVMEFRFDNIEKLYHIDRAKMIQLALLVGSDYTSGIAGVGTVTALEILAAFPTTPMEPGTDQLMSILSCLRKFRDWVANGKTPYSVETTVLKPKLKSIKEITEGFPNRAVVEAYLNPTVDLSDENFTWGLPDVETLKEFAKRHMNWTGKRVDDYLQPVMKRLEDRQVQRSIRNYFTVKAVASHKELGVGKRAKNAIARLAGEVVTEQPVKKKTPSKKTKSKNTELSDGDFVKLANHLGGGNPEVGQAIELSDDDFVELEVTKPKKGQKRKKTQQKPTEKQEVMKKIPRIPNTKAPIPQKVQDKLKADEVKQKAIEIFNKTKK